MTTSTPLGNVLGAPRAELDTLLEKAFIATPNYRAITEIQDYNFVVGRRGTGKSALFRKAADFYRASEHWAVIADAPQEHHALELQAMLTVAGLDYRLLRAIARLAWKIHILSEVAKALHVHYKAGRAPGYSYLLDHFQQHKDVLAIQGVARTAALVKLAAKQAPAPIELAPVLARLLNLDRLQQAVFSLLEITGMRVLVTYDGLDEGWTPDVPATAVIGGLAAASSDLNENSTGAIYPLVFVRDNIFRALAQMDSDFTRHIEGHTLRLHWDERALLGLVAQRLRVVFGFSEQNDVHVWNRFAHRSLQSFDGFQTCLRHTLYRPRDILILLNSAYATATQDARTEIIDADVDLASRRISQARLDDLIKEYDLVLPGLQSFVSQFAGGPTQARFADIVAPLDRLTSETRFDSPAARDFALFDSGEQVFSALYSVGFMGVHDPATDRYMFCHDGSASTLGEIRSDRLTAIHPCYWKALDLVGDTPPEAVMIQINDEYRAVHAADMREVKDLRIARLGEVVGELPKLPLGHAGSREFERWVYRVFAMLYAGVLTNIELKPGGQGVQRRDIVATNVASRGFWRRVYEDYSTRQVVVEVKNYEEITEEDFRQALSYTTEEYGRFVVIVCRSEREGLTDKEIGWVREMWTGHRRMIFILPTCVLARCVRKLRNPARFDYTETAFGKRLDFFVRSYLNLPHMRSYRPRAKSKKRR